MKSYFEIGGIIVDGRAGYDHHKFKRVHRAIYADKPRIAAVGMSDIVISNLRDTNKDMEIPYSEMPVSYTHLTLPTKA